MLHGWDDVLQLASPTLFPPNITMVIMAKRFNFCFIRPKDISTKSKIFAPYALANCSLAFLWRIWSSGFFLAEQPFRLCRYRTHFTVDIDTCLPVSSSIFIRSFAVVLGLTCTFHTKLRSSLGDRMLLLPERYDGCVVPLCLYLHTIVYTDERGTFRCLEIAPKDEPDLWRSTVLFLRSWLISFGFSHDIKQRGTEFEAILWPQKTWKIEQPGYSAKDPLTVFQKSKSYAKQHDQQQNESAELPRTDTPAASVPEFQKDYEKPTGENVNSDYLGFPLLSLPPREDLPHKHPLQLQRTTERTLPIEDNMGSLHHFSPTVPDTAKQITPCSSSSIFQGRDLSQKHKNLKPSVRFMPRTTHLESRKRKLEEQTLFLTEVDKNEPMIGPKLPELPKVDMEDNSLNLTANLIRQTMSKVASVPEVKPIQGKTTTAKPRRRI
ncbi:uncharacterized protein LOC127425298 isoform X1 [Myxocyprinus asiaticus]|uniref:uncharacterized protein LOC127425298 isoform X1 n=1 Tax=Myxocyprinus asiaticus TaxID=70543 RepID=UPI0022213EDA|nr:uncharacterized protein LOC127425298 isoform X1 [Myxocyprinus asiaticus]